MPRTYGQIIVDPYSPRRLSSAGLMRLLIAAGLVLALVGCAEEAPESVEVVRPVKIHTMGELDPATRRDYPGTIRAYQNAEMGFEVEGRITEFLFREGDEVPKGEILARLDPRDYEAALEAASADVRKAEADLGRSLSIQEQDSGAISEETIDTHKRALDVAKARLEISNKALEDTELKAPFGGFMARKLVEDFQNVRAKEPVLILQDTSILEIEVDVPERDIAQGGKRVSNDEINELVQPEVVISALSARIFPARIKEFATTANPVTRTFPVKFNFDDPGDANILPGMTARVRVVFDPDQAWSLPATAVQADDQGEPFVWKVDSESMTVSPLPVVLGELFEDRIKIESGVQTGDMIAISGVAQLRDGLQVRRYE